jgi:hypothetical protein
MTISTITFTDGIAIAGGQTLDKGNAAVCLVAVDTLKALIVDTEVTLPPRTLPIAFLSASKLVVHVEFNRVAQLFVYESDKILNALRDGMAPPLIKLSPALIRIIPIETESNLIRPPDLYNTYIIQDWLGTSYCGSDCLPSSTSMYFKADERAWYISYYPMCHLFDNSIVSARRQSYRIPSSRLGHSRYYYHDQPIWILSNGCAAYLSLDLQLQLVVLGACHPPIVRAIVLPPSIDVRKICEIDMGHSWGILGLYMYDHTVHLVSFA